MMPLEYLIFTEYQTIQRLGTEPTGQYDANKSACTYFFWQLFGACRRSALSDATLRFDLALGVRRRHAPKSCQKKKRNSGLVSGCTV